MYVYRQLKGSTYEVGHYYQTRDKYDYKNWGTNNNPEHTLFHRESLWTNKEAAQAQTSYLNGGQLPPGDLYQYEIRVDRQQQDLQKRLEAVPDLEPPTTHITNEDPKKLIDILNTEVLPQLRKQAQEIKNALDPTKDDPTEPITIVDTDSKHNENTDPDTHLGEHWPPDTAGL
jgi:hypothetical protein